LGRAPPWYADEELQFDRVEDADRDEIYKEDLTKKRWALAIERVTVFVCFLFLVVMETGTGDWRWGIQVEHVPPLYASLPCLLQVGTSKKQRRHGDQMLSISASIGRHLPDL
jgi:hypothetical protein